MVMKEEAKRIIDTLPDEASLDDIMHALYVTAKFQHGEKEIRDGRGVSHDEAKKRLEKWLR